jgi:hypothetical protein
VFGLLEMLYSYIVMFVNMSLCYMCIRNDYVLYVNRSLYVRFVNMSLCYILHSYVGLYAYVIYLYVYVRLYANVMILLCYAKDSKPDT